MNEQKLVLNQVEQRLREAEEYYSISNTDFMDAASQSKVRGYFHWKKPAVLQDMQGRSVNPVHGEYFKRGNLGIWITGGYAAAERQLMVFLPDYVDPVILGDAEALKDEEDLQPIKIVRCQHSKRATIGRSGRTPGHGDYLGSLMGLGIKRELTGDILVREDGADIIVLARMAEYISRNFTSVGHTEIQTEVLPVSELILPEKKKVEIHDTVASLRLDNVLSAAFRISRGKAQEAISQGLVFMDHLEMEKPDQDVEEGAILVIRHLGRAKLTEVGGATRKGRISVTFER